MKKGRAVPNDGSNGPPKQSEAGESKTRDSLNFIEKIIESDNKTGKWEGRVHTRFPPEPNGYLHVGHAKSICLNFGLAKKYSGHCNLRFDDSNPATEDVEYVESIQNDLRWLGSGWGDRLFFASDYFRELYEYAVKLIKKGVAYVDDQSLEEIRATRGTLTKPGVDSPFRDRSIGENVDLFERMKNGEFNGGTRVLRAKINMTSTNLNMRDPVMYRIRKVPHHRTGTEWCIYPMYDFTHGQSDSIERVTHSICTLEFENHRLLYDWYLDELEIYHPQQIEFARLNLTHAVMSKRKLLQLVNEGYVSGWDDPRMLTLSGLRRRGYTPAAIRSFCDRIGVAKYNSTVDMVVLENSIRDDLNKSAPRAMAVLRPLKIVLTNYPEGDEEELEAINNPEDPAAGTRRVPFSRELYIERDDFLEDPPKKFYRLAPGREVRLRYAYFITCEEVIKGNNGEIVELRCSYDPATRGGNAPDGRKVKSTLHWVSARHAIDAEVRLYDHLFRTPNPEETEEGQDFKSNLNPASLEVIENAKLEPSLAHVKPGYHCQFERLGYFCSDTVDSKPGAPVFNRTVTLRDTWAKIERRQGGQKRQKKIQRR